LNGYPKIPCAAKLSSISLSLIPKRIDQVYSMESNRLYQQYEQIKEYIGWSETDRVRIQEIGPWLQPAFPEIVADFYRQIQKTPEAARVISEGQQQIIRLQQTLHLWLEQLFTGPYDEDYVHRRWKIANRHVEIGLQQTYVNAAVSRLRYGLSDALSRREHLEAHQLADYLRSLHRLLDLEAAILDAAYCSEFTRRDQQIQRLATLGQISGGIAHELRNPLNVVKTSVYYLLNAKSPSSEKIEEHLHRIERQVNLASDVITAISEFSKIGTPNLEPLSLRSCLEAWATEQCHNPQVQIAMKLKCDGWIKGDTRQLQIVVGNIVRNACEAMPEGGQLAVDLQDASEAEQVILRIQDNGHGIPEDQINKITDPWFSTKAKGAGLGLAITKAILDRHAALLEVTSQVGLGTQFIIRFPHKHA
jgi:signal transduction histidine kinase